MRPGADAVFGPRCGHGDGRHWSRRLFAVWLDRWLRPGTLALAGATGAGFVPLADAPLNQDSITGLRVAFNGLEATLANGYDDRTPFPSTGDWRPALDSGVARPGPARRPGAAFDSVAYGHRHHSAYPLLGG